MDILKDLTECFSLVSDIYGQSTRKKRACSLKKYLVTDLDIIERDSDILFEKLKIIIDRVTENDSDTEVQDVDYPYCPKKRCGNRQQQSETECRWCGTSLVNLPLTEKDDE